MGMKLTSFVWRKNKWVAICSIVELKLWQSKQLKEINARHRNQKNCFTFKKLSMKCTRWRATKQLTLLVMQWNVIIFNSGRWQMISRAFSTRTRWYVWQFFFCLSWKMWRRNWGQIKINSYAAPQKREKKCVLVKQ